MAQPTPGLDSQSATSLRALLKSQYHAALGMLAQAVERCPEPLWISQSHPNRYWQVAYHAVFYAHLYLQRDEASFVPWEKHRPEYQYLGNLPWPPHRPAQIEAPYSKTDVMEYLWLCDSMVDSAVDALDLGAAESGFWWYKMSKLEHQIVNVRHIQHHAGQLIDRLRVTEGVGPGWIGGMRASA